MKTLLRFIFSKLFFKQLLLAILLFFLLYMGTVLGLRIRTHHNQAIQVPDLKGYNQQQVARIVKEQELRYEIIDSVYSQEVPHGTVFDQIPPAGASVKKTRKLFLIMNAQQSEQVTMPSLKNVSLRQAKVMLEQMRLKLGSIVYVTSEYKDLVINQFLADTLVSAGSLVPKGSEVTLHVGRGLGTERIDVPYLRGMYWVDAKVQIQQSGLNEGMLIEDETITQEMNKDSAFVWKQYPQPQVSVLSGKAIDLWLTMDTTVVFESDTTLRNNNNY